ncbi:MAG TPA: plastocyanin/azurin family copper-binding protein [Gemmatimonadaceae bacterium]|nr:plastocyanin/azurin family copper-binding protein [Gemmatimonadaceae bacterium]
MGLRRALAAPVLAAALVASLACSGGGPSQPPPGQQIVDIRLTSGLRFSSADVTIDPGTTIRWVNDGAIFHTVTPNDPNQAGVWNRTETTSAGVVLTHTFTTSGQTYAYHCEPHVSMGMTGVIRVR